jgi:hypothetical protein
VNVTNCLFERVNVTMEGANFAISPTFRNCTFYGGALSLDQENGGTWTFLDNLFDKTAVTNYGSVPLTADYNGYMTNQTRITPTGAHDVISASTDVGYQTSWYSRFYLPTNSVFVDKASVTDASTLGFYWHTTFTNQTRELTNRLDLGFHLLARDSSGNLIDGDLDGLIDGLDEDRNGNGKLDSGETDWTSATDWGLRVQITNPKANSNIP